MARGKGSKHGRKEARLWKHNGNALRIPPEAEQPYVVMYNSETTNPYTASEIQALLDANPPGSLFWVDPNRLRTMHAGISDLFSDGRSIEDTVTSLEEDCTAVRRLPTVMVAAVELPLRKWEAPTETGGRNELMLFTEDHRRVVAARKAGVKLLRAQFKADPTVVGNFTTKNKGMRVEVRRYNVAALGRHQRGNQSTFPSSGHVYKYSDSD